MLLLKLAEKDLVITELQDEQHELKIINKWLAKRVAAMEASFSNFLYNHSLYRIIIR
jgi:hypothetical protein